MPQLSDTYWKIVSRLYYARRFGRFGPRSWIRRPLVITSPRSISAGQSCFIRDGARLQIINRPGLPGGRLTLGNRVTIEQDAHIVVCDRVEIGDDVSLGPRCTIIDTTHPYGDESEGSRVGQISDERSSVRIGRRVFLGANVVVLPNVTIGENSFIGANSVVSRDVPPNSIAAGVPARVIGSTSSAAR